MSANFITLQARNCKRVSGYALYLSSCWERIGGEVRSVNVKKQFHRGGGQNNNSPLRTLNDFI